jgi:hypothetical protein
MAWSRLFVTIWYVLIGLLVAYEVYALLDGRDTTPPLTWVLVKETPAWLTMGVLCWLVIHLGSRYLVEAGYLSRWYL